MAFDQTKHSSAKKERGSSMIFWGEHFFFDKKFESSSSFEVQKLRVQMMDHNAVLANSLIGEFEIDLVSIYFSDKHAIQYQWAALSNLSANDFQNIKGLIFFFKTGLCMYCIYEYNFLFITILKKKMKHI